MHGADGNAVAKDDVVAPPKHLQWIGSPRWSRHHDRMASMSALVSAKGRIFYVMDEGSRISIQLPPKWTSLPVMHLMDSPFETAPSLNGTVTSGH